MSVWHQVNLMIYPPPFETARAQSELFAFQCGPWEPIQNSQLIGRYKEMSVWHQVILMIYPPIQNCQSSKWTLCFSIWSMRAQSKQSTNSKISGNVSVTPGKSYNVPPYIWQSTEWSLNCSMLSLTLKDRYTPHQHW